MKRKEKYCERCQEFDEIRLAIPTEAIELPQSTRAFKCRMTNEFMTYDISEYYEREIPHNCIFSLECAVLEQEQK